MFPVKDEISEYTMAEVETPQKSVRSPEEEIMDCDLVVANFKVSGEVQAKNSDMGSDCAYFSGPEDDTLNFKLEDSYHTAKKPKRVDSDDEDYSDFKHQQFSPDDDEILMEENDAYLSSQLDYMYSEDTNEQDLLRQSIKEREKEFYGDDDEEEPIIELPEELEIDQPDSSKKVESK